jgi:hypothetical protein
MRLSLNCSHQRAYCSFPGWYMGMDPPLNDTDRETPNDWKKCSSNNSSLTNCTWTDPGANSDLRNKVARTRFSLSWSDRHDFMDRYFHQNISMIQTAGTFHICCSDLHAGVLSLLSSTSTIVVLLYASEHRHKMSARTSAVYKYVKEHYPISKVHRDARELQLDNSWSGMGFGIVLSVQWVVFWHIQNT